MTKRLNYAVSFQQAVLDITRLVFEGLQGDPAKLERVNKHQDCVYLKNEEGMLTWSNQAYNKIFSGPESPIGRHAKAFVDPSILDTSKHTDALILSGSDHLECDHTGSALDGQQYLMRTYKRSLRTLKQPGFSILGITRRIECLGQEQTDTRAFLAQTAQTFRELDDRDQEICRLVALGKASSEIGEELGMTGRNADLRRKKAFTALGVEKPVELVRVLVRLQERGYLDLGL